MAVPMTGEEIDREYQRAVMRAEELESLAAGLRRLAGENENVLSAIGCAWRGESAQQYRRRGNELSEEIMRCGTELLMSAVTLRAEASAARDAKKRAAALLCASPDPPLSQADSGGKALCR